MKSPIDNLPMDGIESLHIHNSTDYVGETRTIRWTEVFFIKNEDAGNSRCEPVDLSRLAETLAQACCIALTPQLDRLKEASLTRIGLRCTIDRDRVRRQGGIFYCVEPLFSTLRHLMLPKSILKNVSKEGKVLMQ